MTLPQVLAVIAAYLAVAVVGAVALGKLLKRRRLDLDAWHEADIERAADRYRVARAAVGIRCDTTGADPYDAARAIAEERQLARVWAIGDALERLPPELGLRRGRRRRR